MLRVELQNIYREVAGGRTSNIAYKVVDESWARVHFFILLFDPEDVAVKLGPVGRLQAPLDLLDLDAHGDQGQLWRTHVYA